MKKMLILAFVLGFVSLSFSAFPTENNWSSGKITMLGTHNYGGYGWVYYKLDNYGDMYFSTTIEGEYGKAQYAQLLSAYINQDVVTIYAIAAATLKPAGHIDAHGFSSLEIKK